MSPRLSLIVLIATLGISACASDKFVGRPGLQVSSMESLPPPGRSDLILQQRSYLVGPLDRVAVDVYGVPELSRTVQVDANGTIALPLVGTVEAAGKTTAEVAGLIGDRLRGRYVRDPQVTVNADTVNQMVTVDGEVELPGLYPVQGRMTLMRAVATARGLSEYANQNYVVVFRRVNDQQMAGLYDLRAIRQGIYEDPEIYANDVVLVGESRSARLFESIIASSALLSAPLVTLLN